MNSETISVTLSGAEISDLLRIGLINANEARAFIGLPPFMPQVTEHTHDND